MVVKFDPVMVHAEDEKEIEAHKENVPSTKPLHDMEAVAQRTMQAIKAAGTLNEEGKKKLHAIVKTRLNGLRDAYKTRAALEATEGLGWSGGELTQALEAIEKMYAELEAAGVEKAQREKREYVANRVARFASNGAETNGMSVKAPSASAPAAAADYVLTESPPPAFKKGRAGDQADSAPQLPSSNMPFVSARQTSTLPPSLKRKGKVRDVTAPRKLSGPVEELAGMTIADFRRLGSTGEEAAGEIQERFQLLEEQSYAARLKGISAWRRSPLYETYVSVVSEALQGGLGLEAVLRSHESSGEEMFKLEEMKALVKLNGMLRV
ncbi:TPA: hypothetical protein DDZ10_03415 [Candidatus Uhrbacteria bacterium]|nr:hypothetical protein [Candidatus Uhrbacteria bacterium]